MKEQKEIEEVNYSGLLTIFFIVLTIAVAAIFFVAGMIYATRIKDDNDCIPMEPASKEEQVIEEENYEIEDTDLINKLNKSIKVLFSSNKNIINSKDKSLLVLNYINTNKELTYDKYKSTYYELFKKEPNTYKDNCYQIEKETIKYKNTCSIIPAKYYIYDYLEDKNNYYVYLAYGNIEHNKKYILYTDESNNSIYKEDNNIKNLIIDDSNYNNFSKFKISFNKDGYNFYYNNVERIE